MDGSFQHTAREDSPFEFAAPPSKSKPTRRRKKRTTQNKDAPRSVGNEGREAGFWTEVLRYLENKTKALGRRTYDMVNAKWKTVRLNVARFYEVYADVMGRVQVSGAGDEHYFAMALLDYEVEH
ncbi:hypothetical protein Tco_1188147 [Tanacetum coccineum]